MMSATNNVHVYLVRYYDAEQLAEDPRTRSFSKSKTTRATSATRAISNVFTELINEAKEQGKVVSKRDFLILEAKVIAG